MKRVGLILAAGAIVLSTWVIMGLARSGANVGVTYAGTTWAAAFAMLVATVSLFAAAPFARTGRLGILVVCAGLCWVAPIVSGWPGGPSLLRAGATLAAAFALPSLVHIALAAPQGRLEGAARRAVVASAYAWSAFAAIVLALVRDPFYDPSCWSDCDGNAFLVRSWPGLSSALVHLRPWVELGLGVAVLAVGIASLRRAAAAVRVSALAAVAVATVACLHAVRVLGVRFEDPTDPEFRAVFFGACAAIVLISFAVVAPRALVPFRGRAVSRAVAALGDAPPPDELERRLAHALDDATLRIVFRLPELGLCVDASGTACRAPEASERRAVTPLLRRGETIAWIDHSALVADAVEPALTPAVRLAVDNARLRAGLLAQVRDLRAARRRIVADGDDERRRLERDLHDGVQQLLLAVAAGLRAAAARSRASDEPGTAVLDAAVAQTTAVLEEVREVAHGIYPAILTDAGLAAAVASLADIAALPVTVGRLPKRRYPAVVEAAAYQVVAEGIANAAAHGGASCVDVEVDDFDGALLVRVHDDGRGGAQVGLVGGLAELADRVGAADGTISIASDAVFGTTIDVVIPCAS
jgi:signal transduction histidine kinase